VLVELRIRPDTDIDKLVGYWGRGMRQKDLRPLLESVARLKDGGNIDLIHLLPPFARERLYTFPMSQAQRSPNAPAMDCHWSTMNFFNAEPDNRFNQEDFFFASLKQDYYPISRPSAYGDILILLNQKQQNIHSAVYLAGDIVFTKNGRNITTPWVLVRIPDMLATYPDHNEMRTLIFRRKDT
jgi:hypothetical protein